jgi:hypothetical protein
VIVVAESSVFVDLAAEIVIVGDVAWKLGAFVASRRAALRDPRARRRAINELVLVDAALAERDDRPAPPAP